MSAVDQADGLVLAQTGVDGKTNEITRFRPLLEHLDLAGCVVTADALHTQRDHADFLVGEKNAHYIVIVKQNQPSLYAQVKALLWRKVPVADRRRGRGHGREERRTLKAVAVKAGLGFPHAVQALQIKRQVRSLCGGRWRTVTVYAVTSVPVRQATPAELAGWVRGHWSIGNRLHWVRDATFGENHCQVRTANAPRVMAGLRNLVIGVLRRSGSGNLAKTIRYLGRDAARVLPILGFT
ncbi:ISAs1 family transposase [Planomonospora sp. ID91781]|uniref:ISAs1 family transposase n=1 Tax=Planomonospora sp. ID91781 TaxID=2738135 RepID=UPI001E3B42BA|nr:ISAs1 family transposase [Planomonospora sp. ID91781]